MFSFKKLKQSFGHALSGFLFAWKREQSFRIQLVSALAVVILMFVFDFSFLERAVLILAVGSVLGFELLNSQLEKILDLIQPKFDQKVKAIKDLSASAVLVAALSAFLVGLFILLFHLL